MSRHPSLDEPSSADGVPYTEIAILHRLRERPSRPPDFKKQSEVLVQLTDALVNAPDTILQQLAEAILALTGAESAGISILETDGESDVFRWRGVAGRLSPFVLNTIPRNSSPCGRVLETSEPQLVENPERHFPQIRGLGVSIQEILLAPFAWKGRRVGTVWAVFHGTEKKFESEDLRIVTFLSAFASAAFQTQQSLLQEFKNRQAAEQSEARLNLALEAANIGFWDWDATTDHVYLSDSLISDWGINREGFGFTLPECMAYIHDDDRDRVWLEIQRATMDTGLYDVEYRVVRPTGEVIWINARGKFYVNDRAMPDRLTGISINVTDRKRIAEQFEAAKTEAENANALKSVFLANMSHEIRTPLGAMLGFAELLRDKELPEEQRLEYIDILTRNGESLSVIINDILDLSKVEAGHLALEFTRVCPHDLASEIAVLLAAKAKEKNLSIVCTADENAPKSLILDSMRVRQILINLLSNALKFTPEGCVTLHTSGMQNVDGGLGVQFTISDTGIGIEREEHENIFEMFVQADGTMSRRFGGTGLGLALSRRLARRLGGDVVLQSSERGKGSTFVVTIPGQSEDTPLWVDPNAVESRHEENVPKLALDGIKVLVVDDSPDNQYLIGHYLRKNGASVELASDGLEAVQCALAGAHDIVLMDIQMPQMDGFTATQRLRSQGYTKPIVALTAHAMAEVRQKCLDVGCTGHLAKPINFRELIAVVARSVDRAG